ncbi:hypothetical protein A203_00125 [Chromobacterium violaceum]|uniref:tail fiber protein n=1 Tax=Chromobacterium violaceum TaxID=536 RepID=UPI003CE928E8
MQKIDTPDGLFYDGNPATGALGTIVRAFWLNSIQGELMSVLEAVGIKPDGNRNQLLGAIRQVIRDQCRGSGMYADLGITNRWTGSLDDIVQPGEYYYGDGCSNTPSKFGLLKCWRENSDVIYQIAHSSDNNVYTRYRTQGGQFTPWRQLAGMDFIEKILLNKANKATTLAGYGIADAWTREQCRSAGLFADLGVTNRWNGSLDNIVQPGEFYFGDGCSNTPSTFGLLKCWRENGDVIYQIAHSSDNNVYTRYRPQGGQFTSWRQLAGMDFIEKILLNKADKATTLAGYGITDAGTRSDVVAAAPAGQVAYFAMDAAPAGWLRCNGARASRSSYPALFAAIGTIYGAADSGTFQLPDLRGEFVRGANDSRNGLEPRAIGSSQSDASRTHRHVTPVNDTAGMLFVQNARGSSWPFGAAAIGIGECNSTSSGVSQVASGEDTWLNTGPDVYLSGETRPRNIALLACIKY